MGSEDVARNDANSELIIGLITTVGTSVDEVISNIRDQLKFFKYKLEVITVSKDIITQFEPNPLPEGTPEFERISHYMDLGNKIRKSAGDNAILMKGVARELYQRRDKDENGKTLPRKRIAYVIRSLKNSEEVEFMRDTYGDGFHLIGVTSTNERRIEYLTKHKGLAKDQAELLLERDANEDLKQGQHTQDAFQHSDYFINITEDVDQIYNSVSRLIDLLFGDPFISPSFDEYAMFMAYAASLRSADLSRQIGAVIAKENEILATGANDCPKAGGGLYWPISKDHGKYIDEINGRDYMFDEGYDSNKIEQRKIIDTLLKAFNRKVTESNIKKAQEAGIGDLTEYGRVVHGEMEALLTCARNNISCRYATLYATTFPCHNCAKHIIAAGIKRVVYIEPYPKSKAFQFYPAEISDGKANEIKVVFEPFTGVGPQKFVDLFALSSTKWYKRKRKNDQGYKLEWKRDKAELRNPISIINYLDAEQFALIYFEDEKVAHEKEISHD